MNTNQTVKLSPREVENKGVLTVCAASAAFASIVYQITDESGRIMRKGAISHGSNEFKLCIVGFKTGVYHLNIGNEKAQFIVT